MDVHNNTHQMSNQYVPCQLISLLFAI